MMDAFYDLSFYTLSHGGKEFIHQHAVDAFTAQTADLNTKLMAISFALGGLYLYLEQGYTGREVQLWHMHVARKKAGILWPAVILPGNRGSISVTDVIKAPPGPVRDHMIREWCSTVWACYRESHPSIISFVESNLDSIG